MTYFLALKVVPVHLLIRIESAQISEGQNSLAILKPITIYRFSLILEVDEQLEIGRLII